MKMNDNDLLLTVLFIANDVHIMNRYYCLFILLENIESCNEVVIMYLQNLSPCMIGFFQKLLDLLEHLQFLAEEHPATGSNPFSVVGQTFTKS